MPDAPAPLDGFDPAQLGALLAQLSHASTQKGPYTPPAQPAQPVLAPLPAMAAHDRPYETVGPPEPPPEPPPQPAVSHTQVPRPGEATIGASRMGERYVPPSWNAIMASDNPIGGVLEHVLGPKRPPSVYAADPTGIDTWTHYPNSAPPPVLIAGETQPIADETASLGRGLYSRVDDALSKIPERGAHPNKVASLLQNNASAEEINLRNLPAFLASKGNQPVTRAELAAHLAANPAPFPETTVLGAPAVHPGSHPSFPTWLRERNINLAELTPEQVERLGEVYNQPAAHPVAAPALPTKYKSYTLPGGESYREHLYTLPDQAPNPYSAYIEQMNRKYGEGYSSEQLTPDEQAMQQSLWERSQAQAGGMTESQYRGGHFDQPNILTHVRTTERNLPGPPAPPPPPYVEPEPGALAKEGWTVRVDREDPYTGQRMLTALDPEGNVVSQRGMTRLTPEEYLDQIANDRAEDASEAGVAAASRPTGPRGRFIEEIQSDWHQQGKRQGYQTPADPAQTARLAQLESQLTETEGHFDAAQNTQTQARTRLSGALIRQTRPNLPPAFAHLQSFGHALEEQGGAVEAWRAARDPAYQHPEVQAALAEEKAADAVVDQHATRLRALQDQRHQLLNPKGVPDAPFKESWPDLALKQQLLDVARDPNANWLGFTGGKTQAARYDLSKQVSKLTYNTHSHFLNAYDHAGDGVIGELVPAEKLADYIGKEAADRLLNNPTQTFASGAGHTMHELSGLDLQVGGEGMHHFYDQLLPSRLNKLLKPVGGKVEPFNLPTSKKTMDVDVPGFSVRDQHGNMRGVWENRADAEAYLANPPDFIDPTRSTIVPATTVRTQEVPHTEPSWIARLSPEMKREILRRGFPLLALPPAIAAAHLAAQPDGNVGAPPPVQPVPSHPRTQGD